MALSNLREYTKEEYDNLNITPFAKAPGSAPVGDPDDKISIQPSGWVGNDVFAFTIVNEIQNASTPSIDNNATNLLNVDVVGGVSPVQTTTYWTVETGAGNGKSSQWTVEYEVRRDGRKTGKWIFVKGKDDDDGKSKPGCMGFLAGLLP
jgi:hypothetical protein